MATDVGLLLEARPVPCLDLTFVCGRRGGECLFVLYCFGLVWGFCMFLFCFCFILFLQYCTLVGTELW